MFVTDFKKIQIKGKKFKTYEHLYKWNQNTEKLEKNKIDWQDEINKYKGMDLKTMLNKGILPNTNTKPVYGDISKMKDLNIHKLHKVSKIDINNLVEKVNIKGSKDTINKEMNNNIQKEITKEMENSKNDI